MTGGGGGKLGQGVGALKWWARTPLQTIESAKPNPFFVGTVILIFKVS